MDLFRRLTIAGKVFLGFGTIILLLLVIGGVSLFALRGADRNFDDYRALARQTNADGRVQANMLMTRLYAKNFVIDRSPENIEKVRERARKTVEMIAEARDLAGDAGFRMVLDGLDEELAEYLAQFEVVTQKQAKRDELVHEILNVVGPQMEKDLTAIMKSAFEDGDAEAAYRAGVALRNLLLARVYSTRFLVQNDNASFRRVGLEFTHMEEALDSLVANLEDPERIALADKVRDDQRVYARTFEDVHDVITSRNDIIGNQLDRIGPKVAGQTEELKLAIKAEQDILGPKAEAEIDRAVVIASTVSFASVALGGIAAWLIGFGISRPVRAMADSMRELAQGNLEIDIPMAGRKDEVGEMATAVGVFKKSMTEIQRLSEEQRQTAVQLSEAKESADSANRAKSAFLASMSHELRTPMNAILGYSEMLVEEAQDQGQDDFIPDLKRINEAGNHLLVLINDILDLSKVESGKMEAFAEDIDLAALLEQVAGTAHPLMEKNSNQFRIEQPQQLGHAHQDLTKLRQSLLNLLSNAAKFTNGGTITLRAGREPRGGSDWLRLAVSDTGIGIPPDKIDKVFEEFGQADDSTSREYGGTGLGLPLSRRFCQLLGGDLLVESQPGRGSTFTILVPATLPGTAAEAAPAPSLKAADGTDAAQQAPTSSTVLVIDDDPEARDIIERLLRKDGVAVATASSGEEGLRLAREIHPAVITLDVVMPHVDGWSVLRMLKADPELRDIPVVMLTMVDDKTRSYTMGATDYLTKPVDRQQLQNALARYTASEDPGPVLLVEDDAAARATAARTLEKLGCRAIETSNGREALERLAEQKPALVLLDLMMPVMDGFEFLLEMRAEPEWQDVPVIVLTGKDLTLEDRRALSGRVEQIVEKGAASNEHLASLVHGLVQTGEGSGVRH